MIDKISLLYFQMKNTCEQRIFDRIDMYERCVRLMMINRFFFYIYSLPLGKNGGHLPLELLPFVTFSR